MRDDTLNYIFTRSGQRFCFEQPSSNAVIIEDIAASLSKICRFTGHVRRFLSVAEHCVNASRIVAPRFALEALLHDAREAFIGDVSSPLKRVLPEYRRVDALAHAAIVKAFDVPFVQSAEVTTVDLALLRHEAVSLISCNIDEFNLPPGLPVLKFKLACLPPHRAEAAFLRRYRELTE